MKILLKTIILSLITGLVFSQQHADCYTVIAGKDATFDGSVLIGHNEDDGGEQMLVNWQKVPRKKYSKTEKLKLINGLEIDQTPKTYSYLWFQVTKQKFADAYMNENSVVICSDACVSKEDTAVGQIGYYLRQILAERSKGAKHAVKLAGKLIEEYGYESSGRTYCIADKNEAWMLSVVQGKRWIAQRIPDDQIAIIPNYYTIQEVDLNDTLNFLSSPDIIDYAVSRGWHEPENTFNFRQVYGDSLTNYAEWNIPRHLSGLNYFQDNHINKTEVLPFSFSIEKKITIDDIKSILSNHHENSDFHQLPENKNPHMNIVRPICFQTTQFSFIAQLRSNMPNAVGSLIWISAFNGCISPYIPIYLGVKNTHESFRYSDLEDCKEIHFNNDSNSLKSFPQHAYYILSDYVEYIESNYSERIKEAESFKTKTENELRSNQKQLESSVLKVYKTYPADAVKILTHYCNDYFQRVIQHAQNNK